MPFSDVLSSWRQRKAWMPLPQPRVGEASGTECWFETDLSAGAATQGGLRGDEVQSSGHLRWSTALQSTSRKESFSGWGEWQRTVNDL